MNRMPGSFSSRVCIATMLVGETGAGRKPSRKAIRMLG